MPSPATRFFEDHGVIRDRKTGQHVAALYEAGWQPRLLTLLNEQEQKLDTLASALHKFAPDLMDELRSRYALAITTEKLALDEFLAFLQSDGGSLTSVPPPETLNNPREWWVYVYPEDPGGRQLLTGDEDAEYQRYPRLRVRLVEWQRGAPLPELPE